MKTTMKSRNTKKNSSVKNKRKPKSFFYGPLGKAGGKKTKKQGTKKRKIHKKTLVDVGITRPRITGESGMTQNINMSRMLAQKSMAQSRTLARGLAQSLGRNMGQSLA